MLSQMRQEGGLKSVKYVKKSLPSFIRNINAKGSYYNLNIRCRRAVCQNCANFHGPVLGDAGYSKQTHRICNTCKEESESIKKFIEQYKLSIGKDTFSLEWLKSSGLTIDLAKKEYDFAQKENDRAKDKGEFLKMKQELQQVMVDFWINLNYSLREFLFNVMKENELEQLQQQVCKVLGAVLLQYPEIGYSPDQVLITIFLLCFCSEASTYTILTILYSDIIPSYLYPLNLRKTPYDYQHETDQVLQVLEQGFKIKQQEVQIIKPFVRSRIVRYVMTLGINFYMFQTSFFMMSLILGFPKSGYDNFIKSLAVSFYQQFEDIKTFVNAQDDAEAQILRNVKSTQCEKDFTMTKVIIFLPQKRVTQSVVIQRSSDKKLSNQIQPEHNRDIRVEISIKGNQNLSENAVSSEKNIQDQRKKSIEVKANPEADEEKANLKQYIEKIEETLMTKHKLVTELQNRIKELQNQPPQIANNADVDKKLLEANEQLRKRISEYDTQISQLEEQNKYSNKLQEDAQEMVTSIQKSNKELEQQLETSLRTNKDLYLQIKDLKNQSSQQLQPPSPLTPSREKNYQINIALIQKKNEEKLQSQIDEQQQKIVQLELSMNQLNKELLGLQQLNQDKLKIIGNLEVRLIELDSTKRENEKLILEIAALFKKIEHHELVIIQQQEELDNLKAKYDQLFKQHEIQSEELDQVRIEKRQNLEDYERKENELLLIIEDLKNRLAEISKQYQTTSDQLNQSLDHNNQMQNLVKEKDETIKLLETGIAKGVKKIAEIEANHQKQREDDKKTIDELKQIIDQNNKKIKDLEDSLAEKDAKLEEHKKEFKALKVIFVALEEKWTKLDNNHKDLSGKHEKLIAECEEWKKKFNDLDGQHKGLNEKYRLIVIEYEKVKGNTNDKLNEIKSQNEDLQRKLKALEDKHQLLQNQHQALMDRLEKDTQNHIKKVGELDLIIIGLEKKAHEFKTLSENQKLQIDNLQAIIKELEGKLAQADKNQEQRHQQLLVQITVHLEKLTKLENRNSKLELDVLELEKRIQELILYNQDYKNEIIKQDEKITILIKEGQTKESEILKLIQVIEKQKLDLIDYEKIIRELKQRIQELELIIVEKDKKIVEQEKSIKKLQTLLVQFKTLSEEMASIN
ncbi:unnamed protein product (macronuclear) [Paramecium tetraurelia]|uniref:Rab-GAP TBC domain-containing protein n=1 Tax=Paramecium tetraurelia TaxID=5888 RepID=A0DR45_PARTE|nr:uncharacterized protein GSPATT00002913001 [Paramecium tetraurelia]CAK85512.1 unnamed protein product [Paramecium tetraurelia]|eukprot:XP_001452909.1 hypothetical protein (macronuclear) [Paramecium tetraurelia strain d4-2]